MQPFTPIHYQNVQYTVILKAFSLTSKNIQKGAYLLNSFFSIMYVLLHFKLFYIW